MEEVEDPEVLAAKLKPQLPRDQSSVLLSSDDEDSNKKQNAPPQTTHRKQKTETASAAMGKTPRTVHINYPDREYFAYSRVKPKPQEKKRGMPGLTYHDTVMPHSS